MIFFLAADKCLGRPLGAIVFHSKTSSDRPASSDGLSAGRTAAGREPPLICSETCRFKGRVLLGGTVTAAAAEVGRGGRCFYNQITASQKQGARHRKGGEPMAVTAIPLGS